MVFGSFFGIVPCSHIKIKLSLFIRFHSLQLLVDEQTSHTLAGTNAHGGDQDLGLAATSLG
jgi:hypothetical protein